MSRNPDESKSERKARRKAVKHAQAELEIELEESTISRDLDESKAERKARRKAAKLAQAAQPEVEQEEAVEVEQPVAKKRKLESRSTDPIATAPLEVDEAERRRLKKERKRARRAADEDAFAAAAVEAPVEVPIKVDEPLKERKKSKKHARDEDANSLDRAAKGGKELETAPTGRAVSPTTAADEPAPVSSKKRGKKRRRSSTPSPAPALAPTATKTQAKAEPKPSAAPVDLSTLSEEDFLKALTNPNMRIGPSASASSGSNSTSNLRKAAPKSAKKKQASSQLSGISGLDVAHTLATKWMSPKQLGEFAKENGIELKKGLWSPAEETTLDATLEEFRSSRGFTSDFLTTLIMASRTRPSTADPRITRELCTDLWTTVTLATPLRSVAAVYAHVRRKKDPLSGQGIWNESEIEALLKAVKVCGSGNWIEISEHVGRTAGDCKDRYTLLGGAEGKKTGKWTESEMKTLTKAVGEYGLNWQAVAKRVEGRTPIQCREKWIDGYYTWRVVLDKDAKEAERNGKVRALAVLPQKHRSNLVIAIAKSVPRPKSLDEVPWAELVEKDSVLAGRSDRRLKSEFQKLLAEAALDGGKTSFDHQLAWLEDRYPVAGKCYTAPMAAKFVARRKKALRAAAVGSPVETPSKFKSAETIDSDEDESEIEEESEEEEGEDEESD